MRTCLLSLLLAGLSVVPAAAQTGSKYVDDPGDAAYRALRTAVTVSPRSSPRQSFSRYTIRAGRNLPDKEFHYLRTVIVTADIHGDFGSELRPAANKSP